MKHVNINKSNIIRFLSCLSFILFLCPFLQTCSNQDIMEMPRYRSSFSSEKFINKTDLKVNEKVLKSFEKTKKKFTYNGYELSIIPFIEFDKKAFLELDFYIFLILDIIIVLSIFNLYFSFKKNFLKIKTISISGIVLLFIYIIGLVYISVIEDFNQIKYGYYLYLLNLIIVVYLSNQQLNRSNN